MIEKIAVFILFLGPLIFFHELGHYFFARLFGVRVEVFSIGFGPKILKFKKGDTEYAISLIPLGGYVKMFGDDPLNKEEIPVDQRDFSFTYKGKWARFWIVMGGPLANFILAYVIFFSLLMVGERMPEIKLGAITQDSIFYSKGVRSGDKIKKVNGVDIFQPTDIPVDGLELIQTLTVERFRQLVTLNISMNANEFFKEFQKHPPILRKPIVVNKEGEQFVITADKDSIDWEISISELSHKQDLKKLYLFKILNPDKDENAEFKIEANPMMEFDVTPSSLGEFLKSISLKGLRVVELQVRKVKENSAAFKAGIKEGDVIVSLNEKRVHSFDELKNNLQESKEEKVIVGLWRKGLPMKFELVPDWDKQNGQQVKLIGVMSSGSYLPLKFIETKSRGLWGSFILGFKRTWSSFFKTVESFKKLLLKELPFEQVGGPLRIGKVASDSFNTSLSYFFQLMALISVNLGVINLFPIPVLDGGHIMFIFLELINRGPVSRRKMEIAQQIGLSLLLMLMVGAIFNDFSWYLSN